MKSKKILVLGATGMLGRVVFKYFLKKKSLTTLGTSRTKNENLFLLDVREKKSLKKILDQTGNIDFIINCIGTLKSNPSKDYSINYTLSSHLEKLQKKYKFKLIDISTDDVFNSLSGKVNENSSPSPNNPYAKSKLRGEVSSNFSINIRTSIIGFDPEEKKGLIEFLKKNKKVSGCIDQIWSGCTALQFARLCDYLMNNNSFTRLRRKTNVVHFAPLGPITKYELLKKISKTLLLKTRVVKYKSNEKIDRILTSSYFDKKFLRRYTTEIDQALTDLQKFEKS